MCTYINDLSTHYEIRVYLKFVHPFNLVDQNNRFRTETITKWAHKEKEKKTNSEFFFLNHPCGCDGHSVLILPIEVLSKLFLPRDLRICMSHWISFGTRSDKIVLFMPRRGKELLAILMENSGVKELHILLTIRDVPWQKLDWCPSLYFNAEVISVGKK